MGMYTALSLGIELEPTTPKDVITILKGMTDHEKLEEAQILAAYNNHPLFGHTRWHFMLRCDSYYFDWATGFHLGYDDMTGRWNLTGASNLKNYSNEINLFLDWLQPHMNTGGYIGWKMYEQDNLPTLLVNDQPSSRIVEIHVDTRKIRESAKEIQV